MLGSRDMSLIMHFFLSLCSHEVPSFIETQKHDDSISFICLLWAYHNSVLFIFFRLDLWMPSTSYLKVSRKLLLRD